MLILTSWQHQHQRGLSWADASQGLFVETSYSAPWKVSEWSPDRYFNLAWSRVVPAVAEGRAAAVGVPGYLVPGLDGTFGAETDGW